MRGRILIVFLELQQRHHHRALQVHRDRERPDDGIGLRDRQPSALGHLAIDPVDCLPLFLGGALEDRGGLLLLGRAR